MYLSVIDTAMAEQPLDEAVLARLNPADVMANPFGTVGALIDLLAYTERAMQAVTGPLGLSPHEMLYRHAYVRAALPPPGHVPADEVHARSVAGIRQVHHRSAGTSPAESESVAGHRGPRHRDPAWPAALSRATQRTTRCADGAFPAEVQAGTRRSGWEPHIPADPAIMRGRTQESPVTSPTTASPSPSRDDYRYRGSQRFGEPLAPAAGPEPTRLRRRRPQS
jgi:hypothetical protein